MVNYATHVSTKSTPQSEPIPGSQHVANSAGGYSFAVDCWKRLDRFLILGCEGGSYYASEKKLTQENAGAVRECLAADGHRTIARIVEISEAGRAPKNDAAIFALAIAAASQHSAEALAVMPRVCRIGTHLFQFLEAVREFRGHGRGLNRALKNWYLSKSPADAAFQAIKYQQRNGWSHRDILRLCKPKASGSFQEIFHWITKGWESVGEEPHPNPDLRKIWAMEKAKRSTSKAEVVRLILDHGLVRECIPTQFLTERDIWDALLAVDMPYTAMMRNLANMTRCGLLVPFADAVKTVTKKLLDKDAMKKAKVHPVGILAALLTYAAGRGGKSDNTWKPVQQIADALDSAFYLSFGNVESTGKRWFLALDVSGSMSSGDVAGVHGLTPFVASTALALVTAAVEPEHVIMGFSHHLVEVPISPKMRLDDAIKVISSISMGGTDCALPMIHAAQANIPADVFAVFTDSETWFGTIHPMQALKKFRNQTGIPAKLIVNGMVSNGFTIADPDDAGCLDVVGFDMATPQLMSDFAKE